MTTRSERARLLNRVAAGRRRIASQSQGRPNHSANASVSPATLEDLDVSWDEAAAWAQEATRRNDARRAWLVAELARAEAARAFLASMPTAAALMPTLEVAEVRLLTGRGR